MMNTKKDTADAFGVVTDGFETEELITVDNWVVVYPASCNGAIRDLGFVYPLNGNSNFVHFDKHGMPYGTYMPKKVAARVRAMRNRYLQKVPWIRRGSAAQGTARPMSFFTERDADIPEPPF